MTNSTGDGGGRWPFDQTDGGSAAGPSGTGTGTGPGAGPSAAPGTGPSTPSDAGSGFGQGFGSGAGHRDEHGAPGGPDVPNAAHRGGKPGRRRPPMWLLIVIGLVVVGVIVAVVLALANRTEPQAEVLNPETVTLAVPTPTVEPVVRDGGSAFLQSLPATVRAYALAEFVEYEPLLIAGALEGYQLTYTDGTQNQVLYAGQWRDAASAEAALDGVLAAQAQPAADAAAAPAEETTDAATDAATAGPVPEPEQGTVEVDGQQVGRYLFVQRADGTGSIWWTNTTVLLQIDGLAKDLRDVYAAFPL